MALAQWTMPSILRPACAYIAARMSHSADPVDTGTWLLALTGLVVRQSRSLQHDTNGVKPMHGQAEARATAARTPAVARMPAPRMQTTPLRPALTVSLAHQGQKQKAPD